MFTISRTKRNVSPSVPAFSCQDIFIHLAILIYLFTCLIDTVTMHVYLSSVRHKNTSLRTSKYNLTTKELEPPQEAKFASRPPLYTRPDCCLRSATYVRVYVCKCYLTGVGSFFLSLSSRSIDRQRWRRPNTFLSLFSFLFSFFFFLFAPLTLASEHTVIDYHIVKRKEREKEESAWQTAEMIACCTDEWLLN